MAAQTCTPSSLADAGAILNPFSEQQAKGVLIYVMAKWLAALGGTNYTADFGALNEAAKLWPWLNPTQQVSALLEIVRSVAVDDGASIPTSASDLVEAAKYPINSMNQDSTLLFLACAVAAEL